MTSWQNNELAKQPVGETKNWQNNNKLVKQIVGEMASCKTLCWQNKELTKWQVGKMVRWQAVSWLNVKFA
jgi:hypothetical protein